MKTDDSFWVGYPSRAHWSIRQTLGKVYGFHTEIIASTGHALHLNGVNTAAILNAQLYGSEAAPANIPLVSLQGSGTALLKTRISNHGHEGVVADFPNEGDALRCKSGLPIFSSSFSRT